MLNYQAEILTPDKLKLGSYIFKRSLNSLAPKPAFPSSGILSVIKVLTLRPPVLKILTLRPPVLKSLTKVLKPQQF